MEIRVDHCAVSLPQVGSLRQTAVSRGATERPAEEVSRPLCAAAPSTRPRSAGDRTEGEIYVLLVCRLTVGGWVRCSRVGLLLLLLAGLCQL